MKNRAFLLELLEQYRGADQFEEESRLQTITFVKRNKECFENNFKPGHITGSALVIDGTGKYTLLTHHAVLDLWIQLGGHSDGHWNPLEVAWREAQEESGLNSLAYIPGYEGIFDIDIQPIPAFGEMPEHFHYDIRILLSAEKTEPYKVTRESKDLKWIKIDEVEKYNKQKSSLRLVNKAKSLNN